MLCFCKSPGQENFILFVRFVRDSVTGAVTQTVIYPDPKFPVDRSLAKFAFPSKEAKMDATFSFCLTSQNAAPTYGYVMMKTIHGSLTSWCLLSQFFYPDEYFDILDRYIESTSMRLLECHRIRETDFEDSKPLQIIKTYVAYGLSVFSLSDICRILIAMLIDCRIVVTGSNLRSVERFCYALLAFIHPLPWPGVFIPILPDDLVSTLYAPFPYIVGIHSSMLSATKAPEMESHLLINVDLRRYEPVNMELDIPREVRKKIDGVMALTSDMALDKAIRRVMLSAVEHVCKRTMKNPAALVAKYKEKQAKMQPNVKPSFKHAMLQSQLVNTLMNELEVNPTGEILTAFTNQMPQRLGSPRIEKRRRESTHVEAPTVVPTRRIPEQQRNTQTPARPQRPVSVIMEPVRPPSTPTQAPVPSPRPVPPPSKDTPGDPFQEITRLAELFKARNANIEERIRESRSANRPEMAQTANPESLAFRSRLSIFQREVGSSPANPLVPPPALKKQRTMTTVQRRL